MKTTNNCNLIEEEMCCWHILVSSSNSGRFALDKSDGHDLTSGVPIAILLGGHRIEGRVEYKRISSISLKTLEEAMRGGPPRWYDGYYFIAEDNNICALCVGMRVQLL